MFYKPPAKIDIPYDDDAQDDFAENERNKDIYILHLHKKLDKLEEELNKKDELISSLYAQIKKYDENFVIQDGVDERSEEIVKSNKKEEKKVICPIRSEKNINKNKQIDKEKEERKKYEKQENKENKKVVKVNQVKQIYSKVKYESPNANIRKNVYPFSCFLQKKNQKKTKTSNKTNCIHKPINQRDDYLDIDSMTYEDLLALEEKIGKVKRGLNETEIKRIDTNKYSKNKYNEQDECPICKEMYQEEEIIKELHCGHIYHTQCIEKWLELEKKCPCCNTEIVMK